MTITVCPAPSTATVSLSPTASAVQHFLRLHGPAGPRAIGAALGIRTIAAVAALAVLSERGLARNAGGDYVDLWEIVT